MKDAPYEFVPMWTGFYLGGHGGAAMGNTCVKDQFDYVGDPNFNGGPKSTSWIAGGARPDTISSTVTSCSAQKAISAISVYRQRIRSIPREQ